MHTQPFKSFTLACPPPTRQDLHMRSLAPLLLCAGLLAPCQAEAHRFEHAKALRLGVKADRLYLSVSYDVNPGQDTLRTRALFDRDSDGKLNDREQALLMGSLEKMCWLWLDISVNGQALKWTRKERAGHRLKRPTTDGGGLGLSLLYEVALPTGTGFTITILDRDKDKTKHVPMQVDFGPGVIVEAASQGEWQGPVRQIRGIALGKMRPLTLRLRRPAP